MKITKIDKNTIEAEKTEIKTQAVRYSYDFLLKEKQRIIDQRVEELARIDANLAEVNILIAECKKLGIGE